MILRDPSQIHGDKTLIPVLSPLFMWSKAVAVEAKAQGINNGDKGLIPVDLRTVPAKSPVSGFPSNAVSCYLEPAPPSKLSTKAKPEPEA